MHATDKIPIIAQFVYKLYYGALFTKNFEPAQYSMQNEITVASLWLHCPEESLGHMLYLKAVGSSGIQLVLEKGSGHDMLTSPPTHITFCFS